MPYTTMSASLLLTKIFGREEETFAAKYVHIGTIRVVLRTMGASVGVARSGYSWGGSKLFNRCWPVKQNSGLILGLGQMPD